MDTLPDISSPLTGQALKDAIRHRTQERPALIDGLVYERTALLLVADSGVGKSTLFIQLAAQASCGQTLFGLFPCTRPLRVYYLMSERDFWEPADRLAQMEKSIPIQWDNLAVDAECVGLNLRREPHRVAVLKRLASFKPDIVEIDPIYSFFEGGLGGDELATLIGRFSSQIQVQIGASVIFGHHTVKNPKQPSGDGQWVDRPYLFYGSQFIRAHVTGYYDITPNNGGTLWQCKKDTYGVLRSSVHLRYDQVTQLSHSQVVGTPDQKQEQFRQFLHECFVKKHPFQSDEVVKLLHCTPRYLRLLINNPTFAPCLRLVSSNDTTGGPNVYEAIASPL